MNTQNRHASDLPLVSVVIPCLNEEKYIYDCLQEISLSNYPQDKIEIIVVDGISDDNTINIINSFTLKKINIITNNKRTTPYSLNLGIKHASGEFILICSSRVLISPDYISTCVEILLSNDSIVCVGNGNCENLFENEASKTIAKSTSSKLALGFGNSRIITKSKFADNADTPMYKKFIFDVVGNFDETLTRNQDDEFNFRVVKYGYKIFVHEKLRIKYYVRSSYKNLFRQYSQYGYWKVCVNKKHKTITTFRQIVPSIFLLFIITGPLLAYPFSLLPLYLSILIFYLLITFIEGLKLTKNLYEALLVQYAFFNFHFGYGFGYLKGIIDFLIFNNKPSQKQQQLTR